MAADSGQPRVRRQLTEPPWEYAGILALCWRQYNKELMRRGRCVLITQPGRLLCLPELI